jgi:glutaredoxin
MSDLREPHAIENEEEEEEEAKNSSQEERVPLLFVDVNLGGIDG